MVPAVAADADADGELLADELPEPLLEQPAMAMAVSPAPITAKRRIVNSSVKSC
jgi:hypothetical protein